MDTQLNELSWAEQEFAYADLGDQRRTERLVQLATLLAQQPDASISQALPDNATRKAAYRFFNNHALDEQDILAGHISATYQRCQSVPLVLAAQDTTELNYSTHPATTGLGPLRTDKQKGLLLHTTLAFTPDGLPLGLLNQQHIVREQLGQRRTRKKRAIEDKESYKWLRGLQSINHAAALAPNTNFICVADREADIYEMLVAEREANVHWLIRASEPRKLVTANNLFSAVADMPVVGEVSVLVQGKAGKPDRVAHLQVKVSRQSILAPARYQGAGPRQLEVAVVVSEEISPPDGEPGLLWVLLTNWQLARPEDGLKVVEWYSVRWGIEIWHKTLKSGAQVEQRQLGSAEALRTMVGLYSVIAWRIQYGVLLGRVAPQLSCEVWLSKAEWQALYCTQHRSRQLPAQAPRLGEAVVMVAKLGGYWGRKGDGPPGVKSVWQGLRRLADLTIMYNIMRSLPRSG